MSGADFDYNFGAKRNWRRWAWNQIQERYKNKNRPVLYLAGVEDFDGKIAKEKGFRDIDLIAVERDPQVVQQIRSTGRLCIQGDVLEAAVCLTAHGHQLAVVNADLTHGLTKDDIRRVVELCIHPLGHRVVFAINLLRGRDTEINPFRAWFEPAFKAMRLSCTEDCGFDPKHRGQQFLLSWAALLAAKVFSVNSEAEYWEAASALIKHSACRFHSYRSQNQTFNSVVFANSIHTSVFENQSQEYVHEYKQEVKNNFPKKTRLSAIAALALRSRRATQEEQR